jgi:hypothetical protein
MGHKIVPRSVSKLFLCFKDLKLKKKRNTPRSFLKRAIGLPAGQASKGDPASPGWQARSKIDAGAEIF